MRLSNLIREFFPRVRRQLRLSLRRLRRLPDQPDPIRALDERVVSGLAPRRVPNSGQLRFLPRLLTTREKLLGSLLLLVFLSSSVLLVFRLVGRFTNPLPAQGGSYTEGVIGTPQYVNPLFASGNDADDDLIRLIYAGLFRFNKEHYVVPDLAESLSVNPEGTEYVVTLKPNLRWSDGQPLTVDDILFTFALIQDPTFKSPLYSSFRSVTLDRVDDRTVKFTLKKPLAPFLSSLTVGIIPEHKWSDVQSTNARLNKLNLEPVGAGPYRVREFRYDATGAIRLYRLEANPSYHDSSPFITTITLRFYPDAVSALEALDGNKLEGLSFVTPEDLTAVKGGGRQIRRLRLPRYTAVFFNEKKKPQLKTGELREALAIAIDRPALVSEVTMGTGEVINGPLPQGFPGSTPAELVRTFDPGRARELLDKAGWTMGEDGFRHKGEETLEIGLTTSDRLDYTRAADIIKRAWEAIGVKTTVTITPASRISRDVIQPRNYDTILFSQVIGADPDPYPFWHSSQERDTGLNLAIFFKKETDKLLEEARATQSLAERTDKYAEFQKQLNEALPAIFLYQPSYLYVQPKRIKGFQLTSLLDPADRFTDSTQWYIKSKRKFR